MKKIFFLSFILPLFLFSQNNNWVDLMQDPNSNFYETQTAFNNFWEGKTIEKGKGWKQFKRWENFIEPRVYPQGIIQSGQLYNEYLRLELSNNNFRMLPPNVWTQVGPDNVPLEGSGRKRGIGRLNAIVFHPSDPNTLYVGAPAGGFWKSTDSGQNWNSSTDFLTNIGVSDIAVHPTNPDTLFIITGDRDGGDTYSYGVMKSYNGGNSWQSTGLSFDISSTYYKGNRILMDPINPNVIIVSTSNGVYRSIDGGDNFTHTFTGINIVSMEFHTTNSNIIYAGSKGSTSVYKSVDNGVTWVQSGSGLPLTTDVRRACISITSANPNVVYALFGNNDNGFYGLYKSSDQGDNWTLQSNSPNLLGWSTNGSDSGGQAWYDLALTVSPIDENIVFVGGVNCWKSLDGGINWNLNTHWYGGGGANYMHADEHMLQYNTLDNKVYSANDGGLYVSDDHGNSWTDISDGLHITQFYKLGVSQTVQNLVIGGTQDNGTFLKDQLNWDAVIGGDGMECIIDYTDENIMYGSIYYGEIRKSTNGGNSFSSIAPSNNGSWVTPYILDKTDPNIIYAGYDELYKSTDGGSSWNIITNNETGGSRMDQIDISKSNSDIILFSENANLFKTSDGGLSWSNLSSSSSLPNKTITGILIHPVNPNRIWLSFSGYSSAEKVYFSEDGGLSWLNISGSLPNVPANCIVLNEIDSLETIYLGTDLGVFTKDSTSNWSNINNISLPNVIVSELEIQYSSNKLFAATFGRGLWSFDLQITSSPIANFNVDDSIFCSLPATVNFTNTSSYSNSYLWDFGDGNTSTSVNPSHTYQNFGNYSVTLFASGPLGIDSITYSSLINISSSNSCIVTLPSSGQGNIQTACNGTLYDVGGPNGNYYDNCNSWITIEPNGADQITLNFLDFDIEAPSGGLSYCNWDYLEIFDGTDTSAPSLGQYCNSLTGSPGTIISSGGAVTIYLHADQSVNGRGFEVDWSCSYPINQKTYIPDDNFESYLEAHGMGDGIPLNDSVLTSNISNVTTLGISNGISDATGIEDFIALTSLNFSWNVLTSLDVSQNILLTSLNCSYNQISSLDISQNTALTTLNFSVNQISSIDLSQNTLLTGLDMEYNQVDSLNLSQNIALTGLNCRYNGIPLLDVTQNTVLTTLKCSGNSISSLDLTQNIALIFLDCEFNQLSTLDLSQNTVLICVNLRNNQLTSLDVRNGNNLNFYTYFGFSSPFNTLYNPNLTCINIDDSTYSTNNWTNIDSQSYFSNNCIIYGCTDSSAINYYAGANVDDGSCIYAGCSGNLTFSANVTSTNIFNGFGVSCNGLSDGEITFSNVTGGTLPFEFSIDGGVTFFSDSVFDNLSAGAYDLMLRDDSGCTAGTIQLTVTEPQVFTANAVEGSSISCYGLSDGTLTVTVNNEPSLLTTLEYELSGGGAPQINTPTFTSLSGAITYGDYYITVTDANSCIAYDTIAISEPLDWIYSMDSLLEFCGSGLGSATITVDPSTGTAPYSYLWSDNQTTSTADSLVTGTYSVWVTDDNGCIFSENVFIDEADLILTFDTVAACNNALNASLTALPNGTAPYNYLWSTGETTATINNLSSLTSYSVSVTDNNGCLIDSTVLTPESAIVNLQIDYVNSEFVVNCYGDYSSGIEVIASGGTDPYTYSIDGGMTFQNTGVYVGLFAGTYSVYTFDDNGCSDSTNVIITEPSELSSFVILIDSLISCNGGSNGAVSVAGTIGGANPLGGTAPYTYVWSNGSNNSNATNLSAGSYTLDIIDNNGCSGNEVIVLTEPSLLQTTANIINPSSISSNDGSIELFVSGGTSPYSYLWSSGQTTSIIINLISGSYSCIISDSNSCVISWTDSLLSNSNSGCTDSLALNYNPLATNDDGSCIYYSCLEPAPINLSATDITDIRATVNWSNMNSTDCMVLKYNIRYRELGTNSWTTKSGGVGNGLCNFGVNTTLKILQNLTPGTTYQYKMKAYYCNGGASTWTLPKLFTTDDICPEIINLSAQTYINNTGKVTFSWDSTGAYVFARVALRINNTGSSWQTAGGFGVYYPTLSVNKFGLLSGTDYRAQGRTFCDSNITSYRSWWTPPIFWTQPTIRLSGGTSISNLDIYPNPSRNIFNISFNSNEIQTINLRIINLLGGVVYNENLIEYIGEYTKQINLSNFEKSIYFLEIETQNGIINKKLILY